MRWKSGVDLLLYGVLLFSLLSVPGCKPEGGWPWSRNMYDSPALQPQQRALELPANTLPVEGGELSDSLESEKEPVNPFKTGLSEKDRERGKALFGKYCAACHGIDGKGRELTEDFATPDLTDPDYRDYSDSDFYSIIVGGGLNMPNYREELSVRDRWLVINHLRSFQSTDEE